MIDKEQLKALYKKCYDDKWDCDNEDVDIGDYCAFCHNTRAQDDNIVCSVDGNSCKGECLIDKSICGSKNSLMVILDHLSCDGTIDNEKLDEAFNNVREALQERM